MAPTLRSATRKGKEAEGSTVNRHGEGDRNQSTVEMAMCELTEKLTDTTHGKAGTQRIRTCASLSPIAAPEADNTDCQWLEQVTKTCEEENWGGDWGMPRNTSPARKKHEILEKPPYRPGQATETCQCCSTPYCQPLEWSAWLRLWVCWICMMNWGEQKTFEDKERWGLEEIPEKLVAHLKYVYPDRRS
jgi:hypothetical protein